MNLALQFPDCRHVDLPMVHDGQPCSRVRVGDAACCGGIFSMDRQETRNETIDARVASSEGSIAVGQGGKYVEGGGTDVAGSSGARLGTTEISGRDISISSSDPDVLKKALETNAQLSDLFGTQLGEFAKEANQSSADSLSKILKATEQLKEESDPEGKRQKMILYIVLGVLALLAVVFWPKKFFK